MADHLFILDEQYRAVGVLSNELPDACPYFEDRRKERLEHAMLTFEFTVPANHETVSLLTSEGFIVYPNDEGEFDLFEIKEISDTNTDNEYRKKIVCENAAVSDLLGKVVRPVKLNSQTLDQIMQYILQGTGWELGRVDYAGVKDIEFDDYYRSLETLHQVMDVYGAELKFRVTFNGLTVTGRYIDVLEQRGVNEGRLFEYGRNLAGVEKTEDTRDLVTALIPVGKDGLTIIGYTPPADPKYEKFDDWVGSVEARERWSKDGQHIFDVYKDESSNAVELFNNAIKELDRRSKPLVTYNVKVAYLGEPVSLGSTYRIKDTTYQPDLFLEARVIERTTSKTEPDQDEVVFGEYRLLVFQSVSPDLKVIQNNLQTGALGAHVIANGEKFEESKGSYYDDGGYYSLKIEVTDKVHLDSCTVYCQQENTSGEVYLTDDSNIDIAVRKFTGLKAGANVIKLDFSLTPDDFNQGKYRLQGGWDKPVFRKTQGLDPNSFPYESGAFKITGSTSSLGYWYWFFNIRIGGPTVEGGYGATLLAGNSNNDLGTMELLNTDGETILRADKDQVSIGIANIGQVVSDSVVNHSADNFVFYVNGVMGSDENDGSSSTPFASVGRALQMIPRSIDGQAVIIIQSDLTEDFTVKGFTGTGSIQIYGGTRSGSARPYTFNHYNIVGQKDIEGCTAQVFFDFGKWFPSAGTAQVANDAGTFRIFRSPKVSLTQLYISGKVPGSSPAQYNHNALVAYENSHVQLQSCHLQSWGNGYAVRSVYHSSVILNACTGNTESSPAHVMNAEFNGMIGVRGGSGIFSDLLNIETTSGGHPTKTGTGVISSATLGGLVQGSTSALATTGTAGTNATPPSAKTESVTYSSLDSETPGASYRYTKTVGWVSEVDVRVGDPGSGEHKGLWFFSGIPATPPWIGKTIKEIWIEVRRLNEGGGSGSVNFTTHQYGFKPEGEPVINVDYVLASFNYGDKKWVRLDVHPDIKAAFQNNLVKGVAIDLGDYAIFSNEATLKFIYQ